MSRKGQKFVNPATGEYFEYLVTAEETGGQFATVKALYRAGGFQPVLHLHLQQDETFEVISGRLTYVLNGAKHSIGPGEKVTLPMGVGHTHFNAEPEDLVLLQTAAPALDFEAFLESLHHHIKKGSMKNGEPPFLQIMVWLRELRGKTYLAAIPVGVQNVLAALLAPVGKMLGYRAFYK